MVPTFVDYVRQAPPSTDIETSEGGDTKTESSKQESNKGGPDGGLSAIIMEYLPGEDMHLLRDRHCQSLFDKGMGTGDDKENGTGLGPGEKAPRRLSIEDAVYLVADVMLPLLKAMHEVGMVHRDVKPSVSTFCFICVSFVFV